MTRAILLLAALAARECALPAGTSPPEPSPLPSCPGLDCKVADHGCACPEGTHYSCDFSPDTWTGKALCVADDPVACAPAGELCDVPAECCSGSCSLSVCD